MKKHIFFGGVLIASILLSVNSPAQKSEAKDKKTEEIIIRKNGDKNVKTTIEIDGDSVTVNGKPLSDYHEGDVSVIKRDLMRDRSRNFLEMPENDESMELNFDNDMKDAKPRTFLGVLTQKATDGVKINSVIKESAAEKAGLQKDDIITRVNDKKITSPEDLMEVVKSHKPNDNVKIDYLRDNKNKDVKVTLGETKERNRTFFYNGNGANGDAFNFKMPPMPTMPDHPKMFYKHNFNYSYNDHPKLGVKIEDTENNNGAKILSVESGSAADKAGLKKDDIITEVNGEKVANVDEIKDQLNDTDNKESVKLKAKRNNADMNFEVKIPKELNNADL